MSLLSKPMYASKLASFHAPCANVYLPFAAFADARRVISAKELVGRESKARWACIHDFPNRHQSEPVYVHSVRGHANKPEHLWNGDDTKQKHDTSADHDTHITPRLSAVMDFAKN